MEVAEREQQDQSERPQQQPWWHSIWRIAVLGAALLFLGGALGYLVAPTGASDRPGAHSVDVGFLQDMSLHHNQAVKMAYIELDKPIATVDPTIRNIAYEIARGQQNEMGRMYQMLLDWNRPTESDADTVMGWMGQSLPEDRMPGLASDDELTQLRNAQGHDGDVLFGRLMIAHHQGGIAMASYAAAHATSTRVRDFAGSMAVDQREEISELTTVLGLPATPGAVATHR